MVFGCVNDNVVWVVSDGRGALTLKLALFHTFYLDRTMLGVFTHVRLI